MGSSADQNHKGCQVIWVFSNARTFRGAGSCCGQAVMSRNLLVWGLIRNGKIPPVGQNLPAEAQGRQDDVASIPALSSEGSVDPFFGLVRADAGAQAGPLRGGLGSPHRAHGWGHVTGRHQELTSSATHG